MTSTNPSYKTRFRRFVRGLSIRYNDLTSGRMDIDAPGHQCPYIQRLCSHMEFTPYVWTLNQRRIKMEHFNSSGSDTSNDLKLAPPKGCGFKSTGINFKSVLIKRTYFDSFELEEFEFERYGQRIGDDFFRQNIGHGVIR